MSGSRAERLDLLYRASLDFGSTLDPGRLLPRVFDRALEALDAEAGSIWMREGDALICRIARGPVGERIEGLELPLGAGIVGHVATSGASELVADARDDPRFVHQVDDATGFTTRSMLAAPIAAENEVLGVIQVLNRRGEPGRFDEADRRLLEGLGATAGLALRNARLHESERRARDLGALLGISRDLTATLDRERLALSLVNLGSRVVPYDRAALALLEGGRPKLHAVSGEERMDPRDERNRALQRLLDWGAGQGRGLYVADVEAEEPAAAALRERFGPSLEERGVRSLLLLPLEDEEGRVGLLLLESSRPDFLGEGARDAAELLANHATVALRNAQLYGDVPLIGLLAPIASWRRRVSRAPRRRLALRAGAGAAVLLLVGLLPLRERIAADDAVLLPGDRLPVRATVPGVVTEVRVEEGERLGRGQPVARLRDDETRLATEELEGRLAVAEGLAAAARAQGDPASVRLAQAEADELRARLALLRARRDRSLLRAPVEGVVLTSRPYERLGRWLAAGESLVDLGRVDRLDLEAWVAQEDVERVRPGHDLRFKVAALPSHTFVGTVTRLSPVAEGDPAGGEPRVRVRAAVANEEGRLRPGMDARAKVVGARRPLAALVFRPLLRWIRVRAWR